MSDDVRLRLDEINANRDAVLAAAVTWWADQIAAVDMPEGPERALTEACDRYMESLGIQFDLAGLAATPARALVDELAQRRHRDDCGGA
jgi:Lon protease-like protein